MPKRSDDKYHTTCGPVGGKLEVYFDNKLEAVGSFKPDEMSVDLEGNATLKRMVFYVPGFSICPAEPIEWLKKHLAILTKESVSPGRKSTTSWACIFTGPRKFYRLSDGLIIMNDAKFRLGGVD